MKNDRPVSRRLSELTPAERKEFLDQNGMWDDCGPPIDIDELMGCGYMDPDNLEDYL